MITWRKYFLQTCFPIQVDAQTYLRRKGGAKIGIGQLLYCCHGLFLQYTGWSEPLYPPFELIFLLRWNSSEGGFGTVLLRRPGNPVLCDTVNDTWYNFYCSRVPAELGYFYNDDFNWARTPWKEVLTPPECKFGAIVISMFPWNTIRLFWPWLG